MTEGTTGQQIVALTVSEVITVTVLREAQITAGFGAGTLFSVQAMAKFSVTKATATTNTEVETITWNFNQPGRYGVYTGVQKVTGQMSTLNCSRVDQGDGTFATEWVKRPGGEYTTWGRDEEGVVRCEEVVPENSIMRAAQREMGCDGAAARERELAKHRAENARTASLRTRAAQPAAAGAAGVPTGFVCDPGYHRIVASNGLVVDVEDDDEGRSVQWAEEDSDGDSQHWQLCTGPDTDGFPPVVIVNRSSEMCMQPQPGGSQLNGVEIEQYTCGSTSKIQRFHIYRDVPGSDLVGIQAASSGGMLGSEALEEEEEIRQYDGGMADGSGTFSLVPVGD